ncbi:MAG: hypothetical protein Q8Q00_10270 [Dehalococcoidia bacterium]|nr:hypothetical protein [Dehalococcoidia bacterium]
MRWLRDRIHGRRRNQRPEQPAAEQPSPEPPVQPTAAPNFERPRLVLLVRDAAGPASYQLHSFEDEAEAASFVQFWFPGDVAHGVIAFWASHKEPEVETGERPAEVVVLVRDETRPKTVCPFSFAGMDLAQSWVVRESDRGLNTDQLLMYWAVPTRISRDHWGRVHLWPSEPPALRPHGRRATLTAPAFQQKPTPATPTETGVATPTKPVFEPNPQSRRSLARAPENEEAPFEERRLPADELLAAIEVEETAQAMDRPAEPVAAAEEEEQEPTAEEPAEAETTVELLPETPPEASVADMAQGPPALEPAAVETAAELLTDTPPETPAVEPAKVETAPEVLPETPPVDEVPGVDEKPAAFKEPEPESDNEVFDPYDEIDELLRRGRWEQREGPFRGFGSPPGKF